MVGNLNENGWKFKKINSSRNANATEERRGCVKVIIGAPVLYAIKTLLLQLYLHQCTLIENIVFQSKELSVSKLGVQAGACLNVFYCDKGQSYMNMSILVYEDGMVLS